MGVDIFFILSGFLIAYGLLKEVKKKDGDIDYNSFILNRYTRLIFVILAKCIYILTWKNDAIISAISALLFITNFVGPMNELWSVSMEMQFYLVSPCIVMFMYKSKAPWTVVIIMGIISWVASFGILF